MWTVLAALLPAAAVGAFYFGGPALGVMAAATAGCAALEAVLGRFLDRRRSAAVGGSALTGLLLGMSLPPAVPVWVVLVGCAAAILLGRLLSAFLGFNPLNPVVVALVFLMLIFPTEMAAWSPPTGLFAAAPDGVTAPAPLAEVKSELLTKGTATSAARLDLLDALIGRVPGGSGETSVLALALGGAFLLWRRRITWHVPASFLGGVAALAAVFSAIAPGRFSGAGFHLLSGGLVLGAFFLASAVGTAPATARGRLVYGAGCGLLTWLIRSFGSPPDGVAFAILLMNLCTPAIDLYTRPSGAADADAAHDDAEGSGPL